MSDVSCGVWPRIALIQDVLSGDCRTCGLAGSEEAKLEDDEKVLFIVAAKSFHEAAVIILCYSVCYGVKVSGIEKYVKKSLLYSNERRSLGLE